VDISGNIRPDGIQAVNIQSLLREKIAFLSGKFSLVVWLCTRKYILRNNRRLYWILKIYPVFIMQQCASAVYTIADCISTQLRASQWYYIETAECAMWPRDSSNI